MSLLGRTIGRYRITEKLGEGGMGVVYRAQDAALGRDVAIKVLRPELGRQPERVRRFSQEARAASALNDPNIVTVHDAGEFEDGPFLVMELVEGESLRTLVRRGALPLAKVLDIGIQAATALGRAHEGGITHRDLKPENLLVRADGYVKILDFGLAKLKEKEASAEGTTLDAALTSEGSILGTAAYMSPEQAMARPVDGRSDIFSLALVLFESWQGQHPFVRGSTLDTLHAIAHDRLPSLAYPAGSPEWSLARILEKALEKEPDERHQTMKDLAIDLRRLRQESETGKLPSGAAAARPPARTAWRTKAALAVAALGIAAGAAYLFLRPRTETASPAKDISFMQLTDQAGPETFPSLTPDGRSFVYAAGGDIWLQRVGGKNPINLTKDSPAGDTQPAFSRDGEQIAFRSERNGGGIFVMGATGESVRRLTDSGYNPAWSPDGQEIVFGTDQAKNPAIRLVSGSQLWVVNASSGEKRQLTKPDTVPDAVHPSWSPHGHRIAYWAVRGGQRDIWTYPQTGRMRSQSPRTLLSTGAPSGHRMATTCILRATAAAA
jgi:tRNA A-37 threonylcarbamoyl transferase component Bud32